MRKVFTLGYTVYLASVALGLSGMSWWVFQRARPLTIEDMARPDYQDSPDRILRKIDRDGVLHDLRPSTKTLHEGVPYATNSDGMRDDHDYSTAKIPGRRRLMFLGDSFTFGWGLRLEYSFVKQVEALLGSAQWEVLNLGVPAYNTLDEVALFEMKGLKYSPDIVILMYHLNDAQSVVFTPLGDGSQTLHALVDYYQGDASPADRERVEAYLREQGYPFDPPWNHQQLNWRNRTYVVTHYLPLYWTKVQAALTHLADLAREHHFQVMVGIIPEIDQPWETYPFDPLHRWVREEMQRHGFAVVDLKLVLSRFPNKNLMLWGTDGHTSAYANRLIAQDLVGHLTN